ncbi:tetratricopeptide repeat protein [Streptomyces sp. NPDC091209]|uniref:tetratricopeptide repeat protein n=1 Tax=Streptomyces sp. NPDC091209 TaxID=3365974 RepID=UPI0037F249D3
MPGARSSVPSMQELIEARRRLAFVGRGAERAAFVANFDVPPQDPGRRFLFHVHGNAGVGKTFLVRELAQLAREAGALTAYVDESTSSVPEAMEVICAQFARQGRRFKDLERLLAHHRERRREADSVTADAPPGEPSAAGTALARAGLVGIGMVPGIGPFAGAVDPARLAGAADQVRAGLGAHLRGGDDVRLVLSPELVLTPVLLEELARAATRFPRQVLFFDTYERTGPFLDAWLHATMARHDHGAMPANVVVVTAGRNPLDRHRWGSCGGSVAELPLLPFTEEEARQVLADRGVVAEPVVEEILRLTGRLPVLVSTLAQTRPADPDDVGDPSATAVDRFLKWEHDPVHRAVALNCAFPRRLDADVFRAAADRPDEEADALFDWLRGLPFVTERGGGIQYHDVVRAPMLRSQRLRSPRGWTERHNRLAGTFARWRREAEGGRDGDALWADDGWRGLRLAESYHLLCAAPRTALPLVLRDAVDACDTGDVPARQWAQALAEAGRDTDAEAPARWGSELARALEEGGRAAALELLLNRAGFDAPAEAYARSVRGSVLRHSGAYERALAEFDRAIGLDPGQARAYRSRGMTRAESGDYPAGIADLDRALALDPDDGRSYAVRGEYHRVLGAYDAALADLDRGIALDPARDFAWASRGATRLSRGDLDAALADLGRALELKPDYGWALARRARVWRALGEDARQMADLDRAVALQPDWAWGACERGDALRAAGRHAEALAAYDRAVELDPAYASAYASRAVSRSELGRHEEALADLDRALELRPGYAWATSRRPEILARARASRPGDHPQG